MLKLAALSPWASNPVNTSGSSGRSNPILAIAGSPSLELPVKLSPRFNTNIANRSQAGNFNYENLRIPESNIKAEKLRRKALKAIELNNPWHPFSKISDEALELPIGEYYTLGNYLKQFPPVPAGVPFRVVPSVRKNGKIDYEASLRKYTKLLNNNGYKASQMAKDNTVLNWLSGGPLYHVEGKDAADWLYNRRGLKLTSDIWGRVRKARESRTSLLGPLPTSVYFGWTPDFSANTPFNGGETNNQHLNMLGYDIADEVYTSSDDYSDINGYTLHDLDGLLFEPWERLMVFLDTQDHELSHAFNYLPTHKYIIHPEAGRIEKEDREDIFFSTSNDRNNPLYTEDETENRRKKYFNMFSGTYFGSLGGIGEYIGAMGRVKRYGAELGFDTFNSNHKAARNAMRLTLHYLAAHPNPKELTPELQRIHSWLNTAAKNYRDRDPAYEELSRKLINVESEETLREYAKKRKLLQDSYIHDVNSPFYKDVLDFMTDSTIQGLVRTNPNNIYLT